MNDIKIGLSDGSYLFLKEATIAYIPDTADPHSVDVSIKKLNRILTIPYRYIDYITTEINGQEEKQK